MADQKDVMHTLAEILQGLRESQPPRTVNYGDADYQAKLKARTKTFHSKVMQNTIDANPDLVSQEVIDLIPKLKPGRYLGGFVEVTMNHKGDVNFAYANKTMDQRMAQMRKFSTFDEMVLKIYSEQQSRAVA